MDTYWSSHGLSKNIIFDYQDRWKLIGVIMNSVQKYNFSIIAFVFIM